MKTSIKNGYELEYNENPVCPHCGEVNDIFELELFELYSDDGDRHGLQCVDCEKEFTAITHAIHKFSTYKDEEDIL